MSRRTTVEATVVYVENGDSEKHKLTVRDVTTYDDVLQRVVQRHGQRDWIVNDRTAGRRIEGTDLQQRINGPSAIEVLERAAKGKASGEEFRVTPKPNSGAHDVKYLFKEGIKGGLDELIDNGINAVLAPENRARMPTGWKPSIRIEFTDSNVDDQATLVVEDNGVGMSAAIVRSYLKMNSTWSRTPRPNLQRSGQRPIHIDQFINPALGRYGMGCNAVQGFGNHYTITTREVGSMLTSIVKADKDKWNEDYEEGGAGWQARYFFESHAAGEGQGSSSCSSDRGSLVACPLPHGTQVSINRLQPAVLAALRDKAGIKKLRGELAQDYYLFLNGIPDSIRDRVPADLQYTPRDTDLSIFVFGTRLHKATLGSLPHAEQPPLQGLLSKYEETYMAKPSNRPFILPLRYVPKELQGHELDDDVIEELREPDGETIALCKIAEKAEVLLRTGTLAEGDVPMGPKGAKGKGAAKQKGGAKAAKVDGNQGNRSKERPALTEAELLAPLKEHDPTADAPPTCVDLLLILFNFPLDEGLPSKPNAGKGTKEPFIFPFWSGRLMPQSELMTSLPKMVEMAVSLGRSVSEPQAFKLDKSHLAGILLLSPEGEPLDHKTNLQDAAYKTFRSLGPEPEVALGKATVDTRSLQGAMHTFDFSSRKFKEDPVGAMATRMLLAHFVQAWRGQDDEGQLAGQTFTEESPLFDDRLVEQSTMYKLASKAVIKDNIRQGELVSLVEAGQGIVSQAPGSAQEPQAAKCFYVVDRFYQDGWSQQQQKVALYPWYPSWFKPELREASLQRRSCLHSVLEMQPLSFGTHKQRMDQKEALVAEWEANRAPHHLAYFKPEAGRTSKSKKNAGKADKRALKDVETTTLAAEVDHLGLASAAPRVFNQDTLFEQIEVGIAYQNNKLLTRRAAFSMMEQAPDFGKQLVASLTWGTEQVWRDEFSSFDSAWHVFRVFGFKEHAARAGAYTLVMHVPNDFLQADALKLTLHFKVAAPAPSILHLKFVDAEGIDVAHERARLGQHMSKLLLSLQDSKGKEACFPPEMTPEQLRQSVELEVRTQVQQPDPTASSSRAGAQQQGWQPFPRKQLQQAAIAKATFQLSGDRRTLAINSYAVPGSSMGGGSRDAQLAVGLTLPSLNRRLEGNVTVTLIAGRPTKIKLAMQRATAMVAKGEKICDGSLSYLSLEDEWHNTYTHNVEGSQQKELLDVRLTYENILTERGRQPEEELKKEYRAALSDTGFASLPFGNVAMGCVGSSATISVRVSDGKFDLSQEVVNRPIFEVHLGFTHPLLDRKPETGRRRVTFAQEQAQVQALDPKLASKFPGLTRLYRLDLLDRVTKFQDAAKRTQAQNKRLTLDAWSSQLDLRDGLEVRLDSSVIRPNGKRYTYQQRARLIDDLNTLIDNSKAVHEVACVVDSGLTELKGMGVQVCNADDDSQDPDWAADIKMTLVTRDASGKQVQQQELPDLEYRISQRVGSAAFSVTLPEQLFEASPCAEVLFADWHNPQKIYGSLYIRQVARPKRLLLLPIGQACVDARCVDSSIRAPRPALSGVLKRPEVPAASHPSAAGGDPGAGPSNAAAASDPYATLAGWKLVSETSSSVSFENLEDIVALQAPGLAVRRGQPFRVYFVASDQYGVPIEVPHSWREALEEGASVTASSVEDSAAGAHAGEGGEHGAGGAAPQATSSCTRASIVPGSWRWDSLPVPVQSPRPAWSMPCISLELVVKAGTGPAKLQLQLPLPGAAGQQEQAFQLQLPVLVAAKSMRADGYVVQSVGSTLVKVRMVSGAGQGVAERVEEGEGTAARKRRREEDGEGGEEEVRGVLVGEEMDSEQGSTGVDTQTGAVAPEVGGEAGGQAADGLLAARLGGALCEVESPEDVEARLQIQLKDTDGHDLQQQGAMEFVVQAADAPWLAEASQQAYAAVAGKLTLQFKVPRAGAIAEAAKQAAAGDAAACTAGALALYRLQLKPSSPSLSHVLPLSIRLLVTPGLYPSSFQLERNEAWPDHRFSWSLPDPAGSLDMERGLPQLRIVAANTEPYQPPLQDRMPASGGAAPACFIELEWALMDPEAVLEEPSDPGELVRRAVRMNDPRFKAKVLPLNLTDSSEAVSQGRKMRMPPKAGAWLLIASFPDGAGGSLSALVARVDIVPGPPRSLVHDGFGSGSAAARRCVPTMVVKRCSEGQEDAACNDVPKIQAYLEDCHGNAVTVKEGYDMRLCVRRQGGVNMLQLNIARVSSGEKDFMLIPRQTLLQMVEAAEKKLPEPEPSSSRESNALPKFELVLLCNLRLPGKAAASDMMQLAASSIGGEYLLATLIVVPADRDIEKLVAEKNILDAKVAELEKKQKGLITELKAAEARVAAATSDLDSTCADIRREEQGGSLDEVIAASQAAGNRARRSIEDGSMVFLDTADGGGPRPRLLKPWLSAGGHGMSRSEALIYTQALELSMLDQGRVLGPVINLAAVERKRVAAALATLAGRSGLFFVIVQGEQAVQAVDHFVDRAARNDRISKPNYHVLNLEDQNTARNFRGTYREMPGDHQHRLQLPFGDEHMAGSEQRPPINFVGYAVNLLRLPPTLLDWRMTSGGRSLTLRQSLLMYLFGEAMVFETKADMDEFRRRYPASNRMVALDGSSYNMKPGLHSRGGEGPDELSFSWSGIPAPPPCAQQYDRTVLDGVARTILDGVVRRAWGESVSCEHEVNRLRDLQQALKDKEEEKREAEEAAEPLREGSERQQACIEEKLERLRQQLEKIDAKLQQANVTADEGEPSAAGPGPRRQQGGEPSPSHDSGVRKKRAFGSRPGAKQKRGEPAGSSPPAGPGEQAGGSQRSTRQRRA